MLSELSPNSSSRGQLIFNVFIQLKGCLFTVSTVLLSFSFFVSVVMLQ